jgi:ribosome biogenesis GTPase / thiamine phosphate phosphatase
LTSAASFDALVPYGWDERVAALYASSSEPHHRPGRVGRVDRDRCTVRTTTGPVRALAGELPVTGDWVLLRDDPVPVVDAVLPRWSALEREGQLLAANVDLVLVVAALDRPLNLNRMERELVLAWDSGARPIVVLTKADSSPDVEISSKTVAARAVGVDVITTSAATGEGVDEVLAALRPNRTAVLLGPSGAGKSTLVNRILDREAQVTAAVREGDHKGRHTTTSRHLLAIPAGGVLIDTPGLRSVGLTGAEGGVALAFPDIEETAGSCRFRDCRHVAEPGCAVVEAVREGRLDADRLASYRKVQAELEETAKEPWAKAADNQQARVVHRAMKRFPKKKR